MCKLLIMTGITESLLAHEFMKQMAIPMSKSNTHGIGYTAVDSKGDMFSERWHRNSSFMQYDTVMVPSVAKKLARYAKRLPDGALDTNYSEFGKIAYEDMRTVTMHTRFATCGREFANTHPFIYNDVSLIHNGTIRNADILNVNKISSCDSEAALQTYIQQGVNSDTTKAKGWLDKLLGSWAFGILSRDANNNRVLDVVRGSSSLYFMEIEGLGKVFTTDSSDAIEVCKAMNLSLTRAPTFVDLDSMFRFDAITGELIQTVDVKPIRPVTSNWNRGHDYYQYGRTGMTSGTSGSGYTPNPSSPTSKKDQDYNKKLMLDYMGVDNNDVLPDLMNDKGTAWDYRKVKLYCDNINEPLLDRLDIFDIVYNRGLADAYEALPESLREYVRDCDIMQGFKEARTLLVELSNGKIIGFK